MGTGQGLLPEAPILPSLARGTSSIMSVKLEDTVGTGPHVTCKPCGWRAKSLDQIAEEPGSLGMALLQGKHHRCPWLPQGFSHSPAYKEPRQSKEPNWEP